MNKSIKLNFYSDPGHGWVKILKSRLVELGIADSISSYSYERGDWAYLEEDCDYSRLHNAFLKVGVAMELRHFNANKYSKIRSYNSYKKPV
jgi:hypothetical protein